MKKLLIKLLTLLLFTLTIFNVNAETLFEDMSSIKFEMLTSKANENENVVVSRYYNEEDDYNYLFCLEPNVKYNPTLYKYHKYDYDNEDLYLIIKAYDSLEDKTNDDYIISQLLIWQSLGYEELTFPDKEYLDLNSNRIIDKIISFEENDLYKKIYYSYIANKDEENIIADYDLAKYDIDYEGIEIVSLENNEIIFKPVLDVNNRYIHLVSKIEDYYIYESTNSQNILSYEGDFSKRNDIYIEIKINEPVNILEEYITLNFTKKDENNKNLLNTEFKLYEIDENSLDYLTFIQKDKNINLYELYELDFNNEYEFKISDRFKEYLKDNYLNSKEYGYFDYEILENNSLYKKGRTYVVDDEISSDYLKLNVNLIDTIYSKELNQIDLIKNKKYLLCESKPLNGYEFKNSPCIFIDSDIDLEYDFINLERNYNLKLIKEDENHEITLKGAIFKINYGENDLYYKTGYLSINNTQNKKYVIYSDLINTYIKEIDSYLFIDVLPNRYYYYLSDENIIDEDLLKENYIDVVEGGFIIKDLPYSKEVYIEEVEAPKGFYIKEKSFILNPSLEYDEIVFSNFRVNYFDIIPNSKEYKFVKTCIED